ncbi:protein of unknown function [Rhodovastum atsumiense]|nr:protein of unknown function [Rhodovastum atsumiense]
MCVGDGVRDCVRTGPERSVLLAPLRDGQAQALMSVGYRADAGMIIRMLPGQPGRLGIRPRHLWSPGVLA